MGIIKNIELNTGAIVVGAYARIDNVAGSKTVLAVSLTHYLNQAAYASGKAPLEQKDYYFTPSVEDGADNFIKQGYEYVKTLEEFEDAVDA